MKTFFNLYHSSENEELDIAAVFKSVHFIFFFSALLKENAVPNAAWAPNVYIVSSINKDRSYKMTSIFNQWS